MKAIDLTGKTFGRITALSIHGKTGTNINWNCVCSCGKAIISNANRLRSNKTKSCGCLRREKSSKRVLDRVEPLIDIAIKSKKRVYIASAVKRNLIFDLSDELFSMLIQGNCFYCGSSPSNEFIRRRIRGKNPTETFKVNGIDRIDSSKGYFKDNCVSCCTFCNMAKSDRTLAEFEEWLDNLVKFRSK